MKNSIINNCWKNCSRLYSILFLTVTLTLLVSCSSHKDVVSWNVELKEGDVLIKDKCSPEKNLQSLKSPEKPELVPATEDRDSYLTVIGVPCTKGEEPPVYQIPVSRVKRVTYLSDPLMPPEEIPVDNLPVFRGCCRIRDGWWIFDKFEIRGLIGYRGTDEQISYFDLNGTETIYKSKFIGFDRGGSTLFFGLETSGMWNLPFIDKNGNLQAGFILGLLPTDGALFVPLGLNVRYTFNQKPAGNFANCNSWYLYGNIGLPIDFQTGAPAFNHNINFQRYFYGFGIGYDWALSCKLDFSLDLGYREMNLPLPACEACSQIPNENKYPYRNSKALILRFGLTF